MSTRARLPIWWFVAMFAAVAYCVVAVFGDNSPPGVELTYEIDRDALLEADVGEAVLHLRGALDVYHVAGSVTARPPNRIELRLDDPSKLDTVLAEVPGSLPRGPCLTPATACFQLEEPDLRGPLDKALTTTRDRVEEKGGASSVFVRDGMIVVRLVDLSPDLRAQIADLIGRTAKLEIKVVDDCAGAPPRCTAAVEAHEGSALMQRVFARVHGDRRHGIAGDPAAAAAEITAEVDDWQADDNRRHTDFFLRASDREEDVSADEAKRIGCYHAGRCVVPGRRVLERYLAALAADDPMFAIPNDHEIAFEPAEPPRDAKDRRRYWRSYYLDIVPRLTGASIMKASTSYDANTNRPIVMLELTQSGAASFGELTAQVAGMKLATLLDGRIKSAPIVNGAIRGGRVQIAMGGSDPKRAEREAMDLVAVLNTGSGPRLREAEAREFAGMTGVSWPKLVPGLVVFVGLVGFALLRRRAA